MNKYVFASFNENKYREISSQLTSIKLISLKDLDYNLEIKETGSNLHENAFIKSNTIYTKYKLPCISDDTGLEVMSLNGEPGVFSARYAGPQCSAEDNIKKLLNNLKNIKNRRARFRTVICLKTKFEKLFFEGVVNGSISRSIMGNEGFGYDPIFIPDGFSSSFAQMTVNEKNKISHRAKAVSKLICYLNS